jgi:hypothetical protein
LIVQAAAAAVAVLVAILGIKLGLDTLQEQQRINEKQLDVFKSQLAVDQIAQDRSDSRYAAKIAWWETPGATWQGIIRLNLQKARTRQPGA